MRPHQTEPIAVAQVLRQHVCQQGFQPDAGYGHRHQTPSLYHGQVQFGHHLAARNQQRCRIAGLPRLHAGQPGAAPWRRAGRVLEGRKQQGVAVLGGFPGLQSVADHRALSHGGLQDTTLGRDQGHVPGLGVGCQKARGVLGGARPLVVTRRGRGAVAGSLAQVGQPQRRQANQVCLQLSQRQLQRLLGPVGVTQQRGLPLLPFDVSHIPEKTGHHHDEQHQSRHVRQAQKAPGQPVGRNADVRQGGMPGRWWPGGLGGRGVRVVVGRHGQVVIRVMLCCSKKRPVDGVRPRHTAIFHGIAHLRRILRCGAGYRSLKFGLLSIPPYLESGDPCFPFR